MKEVQGWDVEKFVPGHGPLSAKDAFQRQSIYLEDLRKEAAAALAKGFSLEEAQKAVKMDVYKNLAWSDLLVPRIRAIYVELRAAKNK